MATHKQIVDECKKALREAQSKVRSAESRYRKNKTNDSMGDVLAAVAEVNELKHNCAQRITGGFRPGMRVQLHPGTDRWMMGDRYGEVVGYSRDGAIKVKLDVSGKTLKFSPENLMPA